MALGQKPLTFFRQVLSLVVNPLLLEEPTIREIYPPDAVARARRILGGLTGNNLGAYSGSQGTASLVHDVANFISQRDGTPSRSEDILMGNGASDPIAKVMTLLIRGPEDGIMVPVPQYPLYSATISLLGGSQVPYHLDEAKGWGLDMNVVAASYARALEANVTPRAIVLINPGNPTGQVLARENIEDVIKFCHATGVMLLADEVYQANAYSKPFVSVKQVLRAMGEPFSSTVQVGSFHSTSKGFVGECGFRGGYLEAVNFHPEAKAQLWKLSSIALCCNIPGQVMVSLMVDPPKEGDPSYALYAKERDEQLASLKRRALKLTRVFNAMEGVTCNDPEGAMYLFPNIRLPPKAIAAAAAAGKAPDAFYCLDLLARTGICVVPGSGFLQADGTHHFRTTFLPPESEIDVVAEKMVNFHNDFMKKYKD